MSLLYYLSFVAIVAAFVFVILSLASGLLYVSELIEEHSRLAKVVGQRGIYAIIVLHVILYFSDSLPFFLTMFSITCHIIYLQNFSHTWPVISLSAPSFIASSVLVIADHFLWFFHFARISQDARHRRNFRGASPSSSAPGFTEIATFFGICVWLAPLFLFLSLSANDNALPTLSAESDSPSSLQFSPARVSIFRSIFSSLSFDFSPRIRSKPSRRDTSEGIIAPRSPLPPPSPTVASQYTSLPSPRHPGSNVQNNVHELDPHLSPSPSFRLGKPPARSSTPTLRQTGDVVGLGLRRTSRSMGEDRRGE